MSSKIATLEPAARKRAANRVRRLRAALGLSREELEAFARARGVDACARTIGNLERGAARMTALELVELLEEAVNDNAKKAA